MVSCATSCVKYFFFAFNFIFWLLGVGVLGIGIYSRVESDSWKSLLNTHALFTAANLLIVAGVVVATIGFLGCCGAVKKYQCMLLTYAIIVLLIFFLEVGTGVYAYAKRSSLDSELEHRLTEGIINEYGKKNIADKGLTKAIDWFQKHVECCGFNGPDDWHLNSTWFNNTIRWKNNTLNNATNVYPASCCKSDVSPCVANANRTNIYTHGCIEEGEEYVKHHLGLIGGVGIGIASAELLGVVFSICLYKAFREEEKLEGRSV